MFEFLAFVAGLGFKDFILNFIIWIVVFVIGWGVILTLFYWIDKLFK